MDNNNSLPYGAISSTNENLQVQEGQFLPTEVPVARNNESFNPLLVARNVHFEHPTQSSRNAPHSSSRQHRSTQRNNYYRQPQSNYNSNMTFGENLRSPFSNLSDSNSSLIIDNNIPFRDTQTLETSNQLLNNTGMTNVLQSSRYFHPPWTNPERTPADETPRTASHGVDVRANTHLPIIKEEGIPTTASTSYGSSHDTNRKHGILKRRVSREDTEDGLPRPASKVLLTEEKMAAKLHNLRISSDHCYHANGLPLSLVDSMNGIVSESSHSLPARSNADKREEENKEDDNNNMESDSCMFTLAPGIKEALENNNQMLPQSIIDQMSKPCLAVIPWKPPNEVMRSLNFYNKTDDEKADEKNSDYFKSKIISNTNHQTSAFSDRSLHVEAMDDLLTETFDLDEDDMDL